MKSSFLFSISMIFGLLFSACVSTNTLQSIAPISVGEIYCQPWRSGIDSGGSGINLYIQLIKEIPVSIQLDSVYFRHKVTTLELVGSDSLLYVGRFHSEINRKVLNSTESNEDPATALSKSTLKVPFELNNSECVISYLEGGKIKYFKVDNISEKTIQNYPSIPSNRQ